MDTIQGNRFKFTVVFGVTHTDWNMSRFFRVLEEEITTSFGGCRVEEKRGLWRDDGNGLYPHTGELFEEDSVEITFLTDTELEKAKARLRKSIEITRKATPGDVPMKWVHVEITQAAAYHLRM